MFLILSLVIIVCLIYFYFYQTNMNRYNNSHKIRDDFYRNEHNKWATQELDSLFDKYESWQRTKLLVHSKHPALPDNVRDNVEAKLKEIDEQCRELVKDLPWYNDELLEARFDFIIEKIKNN